ncbi:bifunctional folylpolyglutamate synthase/dihydrofolate synthase [Candidatus Nitrospira allomarina]|uniref:Dihydrofolate synthase/folylpolyglutamate synthase n=1 Tax=Candidatus Nitrospira allomarina TaxID=3020900 RepID=A0AA96JRC6_9BACT|nr:folylpolyglutamate synthase/dihydrofolate synthase family protein [Candidatus Nitrospira allomarina]WNM56745.1 bifunctional folylpolyglutamate synthase/dihydrofolate synthase [Candidatus Nitrospira allomarina]
MASYPETLNYLFSLHRFGIKLGLEAITDILGRLGNPQHRYPTLHVAGTNGKGSSSAMLARILEASGYRVGLYTSPHLIDFRERIRVQGTDISEESVCALTDQMRRIANPLTTLTFFEFTTALAFLHFQHQQVDIAVVEVGMGGQFDATNVLSPMGALITGISFDHEAYLGDSLQKIAREKAGIITQKSPVVLGPMPKDILHIFETQARKWQAPCFRMGQEFSLLETSATTFTYQGPGWTLPGLQTNLPGRHQLVNATNALALLETAVDGTFPISPSAIRTGLQDVRWRGRLEIVQQNPLLLLDGAHNLAAAHVLFDFLHSQIHDGAGRKLILVVGMMRDKNLQEFLRVFIPIVDHLILTQPRIERAASVDELNQAVDHKNLVPCLLADSWEAVCRAKDISNPTDVICVTGSLFLVGEVLNRLTQPGFPT